MYTDEINKNISNDIKIEDGLTTDIYFTVSLLFAKCRQRQNFDELKPFLTENITLVLYEYNTLRGIDTFINYWVDREKRVKKDGVEIKTSIKLCNYNCHVSVYDIFKGYKNMFILFRIINNKITHVISAPEIIQDPSVSRRSFNQLPYSYNYASLKAEKPIEADRNKFFCFNCGTESNNLKWLRMDSERDGNHLVSGKVSLCEKCKRVVEYFPDICFRLEDEQLNEQSDKPKVPDFHIPQLLTLYLTFSQPLRGTNYFDGLDKSMIVHHQCEHFGGIWSDSPETQPCKLLTVAEEFNTFMLQSLKDTDPEIYESIKQAYSAAVKDGIYEAANNLGVLLVNYEHNWEDGMNWLRLAANNGSKNAMQNIFAYLWGESRTQTIDYLKTCNIKTAPIRLLWNLATLNLRGSYIADNPYRVDINKGKRLLQQIVESNIQESEDDDSIITKAKEVLAQIESNDTNEFGINGIEFLHYLNRDNLIEDKDYRDDFNIYLHLLHFENAINVHIAFEKLDDCGDESWFFDVSDINGDFRQDNYLETHVNASKSPLAAWQIYLLMASSHVLPYYWHGEYNQRQYIFSISDLARIRDFHGNFLFENDDLSIITDAYNDILPSVKEKGDNMLVSCCYWNLWRGLIRETVNIQFSENQRIKVLERSSQTYYQYDCQIYL